MFTGAYRQNRDARNSWAFRDVCMENEETRASVQVADSDDSQRKSAQSRGTFINSERNRWARNFEVGLGIDSWGRYTKGDTCSHAGQCNASNLFNGGEGQREKQSAESSGVYGRNTAKCVRMGLRQMGSERVRKGANRIGEKTERVRGSGGLSGG